MTKELEQIPRYTRTEGLLVSSTLSTLGIGVMLLQGATNVWAHTYLDHIPTATLSWLSGVTWATSIVVGGYFEGKTAQETNAASNPATIAALILLKKPWIAVATATVASYAHFYLNPVDAASVTKAFLDQDGRAFFINMILRSALFFGYSIAINSLIRAGRADQLVKVIDTALHGMEQTLFPPNGYRSFPSAPSTYPFALPESVVKQIDVPIFKPFV